MAMTRRLHEAARKSAVEQKERLAAIPAAQLFRADVKTVTAGAGSDGNALVTVTWRGGDLPVADYPDNYTPTPGTRVLCALVDGELSILHRGIGFP